MIKRFVGLFLIFSIILVGCGKEEITAQNIVTKMRESQANTNDVHAVVEMSFSSREESGSVKAEMWMRKTGQKDAQGNDIQAMRMKVLEASEPKMVGAEMVTNGDAMWAYDPDSNTAYVGTKADMENRPESNGGQMGQAEMLLQLQEQIQQGLDAVNIEILGQEQIASANAYKLKIAPKPETQQQLPIDLLVDITLWVNDSYWMPVKLSVDAKDMGKLEITATTLDVNKGVDAAMFEAQPPAGATIVQIADVMKEMAKNDSSAVTLDEAKAQAGFPVLGATETAGAALVDVQLMNIANNATVVQTFSGPDIEWSLVQTKGEDRDAAAMGRGTSVKVRGVDGTLIEGRGNVGTLLTWKENGISYVIAGNVTAEQATAIANGLK